MSRWLIASLSLLIGSSTAAAQHASPDSARIVLDDVARFITVQNQLQSVRTFDDSAKVVFDNYYLPGSVGLREFIESRIGSPFALVRTMSEHRKYYAHLGQSLRNLQQVPARIRVAYQKLETLLPEAVYGDTYFLIGRMNSGGTTSARHILIGTEMYGLDKDAPSDELGQWHKAVLKNSDDLDAIAVHELMHINQAAFRRQSAPGTQRANTLLTRALHEGGADFVAELVTGKNINAHVHAWANPREKELWLEFQSAMNQSDVSRWLSNGGTITDRPADLGYWMGYRIARAYYERAPDKRAAIKAILELADPPALLKASGYGS